MGYRYACADFTFPLLPHESVLKLIHLLGFDGVDVGLFEDRSHIRPEAAFQNPRENGALLKECAEEQKLMIADVFLQSDLDFSVKAVNHPDGSVRDEERKQFEKLIEYALAAGSGHITCLPGVHFAQEEYEASYERAVKELSWRVIRAKQAGIIFGVEAHLGSIADTPEKAAQLVTDTEGLTLTLDYTHFTKIGIEDGRIAPLIACASHFHARGAACGRLQTPLGENTIDYSAVLQEMKRRGYQGFIGIEYTWSEWEECNRTDNVSESILLMERLKEIEKVQEKKAG